MELQKPKTRRRTAAQMYPLMEAYAEGGQTQAAFCAAEGLKAGTFQYWWRRYREEAVGERSGFVALEPQGAAPLEREVELHYGPVRLCLGDAPADYVAELVQKLAASC